MHTIFVSQGCYRKVGTYNETWTYYETFWSVLLPFSIFLCKSTEFHDMRTGCQRILPTDYFSLITSTQPHEVDICTTVEDRPTM